MLEMRDEVPPPLAYTPEGAGKVSALSRRAIFEAIAKGELVSMRVGGRRRVLHTDLMNFLQSKRDVRGGQK